MSAFSSALLTICCVAAALAGPRVRRRVPVLDVPGGIPLGFVFAACEAESEEGDIGPCLAQLLSGVIDSQRQNFTTGIEIGNDVVVLEPLTLDDIEPKKDKEFQVGVANLKLYGIQEIQVDNVTITVDKLAIEFSLPRLTVSGDMSLKYLFVKADPEVTINLERVKVHLSANWSIEPSEDGTELFIVFNGVEPDLDIGDLNVEVKDLPGLGIFVQRLLTKNSAVIIRFFLPDLEKGIRKRLNEPKVSRIRIAD